MSTRPLADEIRPQSLDGDVRMAQYRLNRELAALVFSGTPSLM